ncbi:ribonuclease HII [Psychroserpens sp. AS72]|uniref:ribonuclease HII n=1 Tax=Psychroserpens sp. AS72 TaxID=3135775 RepID=UPI003176CA73
MKKIWFICISFLLLFNCENSKSKSISTLSLVPNKTEILIKINSSEGLEYGLKNNPLANALENYSKIKDFKSLLVPLYDLNKNHSLIALSKDSMDSLNISYIIPFSKEGTTLDSIKGVKIDSAYNNKDGIKKLLFNKKIFYCAIRDSILFASNNLEITENSQKQNIINSEIETIFNTSSDDKMVSILINHNSSFFSPKIFKDSTLNTLKFSNYTLLDGDISNNSIVFNGITKANDSTKSLINIFKNTIAHENKVASVLPVNITSFTSLTFDSIETIRTNLQRHQLLDTLQNENLDFQNIVEVSQAKTNSQNTIIIRSIDPATTLDNFAAKSSFDTYRDVTIFSSEKVPDILTDFKFIFNSDESKYFIVIDDFFMFSDDIDFLKSIISNYQSDSVLSNTESYKNLKQSLSDESSLLIYGDDSELNVILNTNFTDDKNLDISKYKSNAIQYTYDTNFAHITAVFLTHKNKGNRHTISEEFNMSIDAELLTNPQFVTNHTNNQKDIVVQDINNNLYLISNQGKVYWKKQLEGKILGKIEQIDTYKNGRLQLVFNTSKRLYVLDRNGKNVNNFPLKFNDDITQAVSVFDYDNKKNYRLMITQGNSVLMYDKNGDIVKGFKYKNAANTITSQPKHFRIGRKDFIVFTHGNKMEVLDRVGNPRFKIKEDIDFSKNDIYLHNNNFTISNSNGELIQVNSRGKVSHKNLNLNSNHKIATTSKTFVSLSDNKLMIKSNIIELDFGDYTPPKIFYINDKIYVTVTDLQSKKGFLFDSQAKPIANFPVYANSQLELGNIDKDNSLEVVTKGDTNAIIVYEIR